MFFEYASLRQTTLSRRYNHPEVDRTWVMYAIYQYGYSRPWSKVWLFPSIRDPFCGLSLQQEPYHLGSMLGPLIFGSLLCGNNGTQRCVNPCLDTCKNIHVCEFAARGIWMNACCLVMRRNEASASSIVLRMLDTTCMAYAALALTKSPR